MSDGCERNFIAENYNRQFYYCITKCCNTKNYITNKFIVDFVLKYNYKQLILCLKRKANRICLQSEQNKVELASIFG